MEKYTTNIQPSLANKKAAQIAVAKGQASSVKKFYEHAIDKACSEFYEECAKLENLTLEQWLDKASKGEF